MAHFAEINNENIVLRVVVICNEDCIDENGFESEEKGIETCKILFGQDTNWIQTSYTGRIRKLFAGIGFIYNPTTDEFEYPLEVQDFNKMTQAEKDAESYINN